MKPFLSFSASILFRIIIPGVIGALSLFPLITYINLKLNIHQEISYSLLFVLLSLTIGFLASLFDSGIYQIYSGQNWPQRLRGHFTDRFNEKIEARYEQLKKSKDAAEKQTLLDWLAAFPLKSRAKTKTEAVLPTRLGNIVRSYEAYPSRRYGMSGPGFWPRMWMVVEGDRRREMDAVSAQADCATYVSFLMIWVSGFYVVAFIFDGLNFPTQVFGPTFTSTVSIGALSLRLDPLILLIWGLIFLVLARSFYLISLPLHLRYGDYFRAVFDLHRESLRRRMTTEADVSYWDEMWSLINYSLRKCPECQKFYPADKAECPYCKKKEAGQAG